MNKTILFFLFLDTIIMTKQSREIISKHFNFLTINKALSQTNYQEDQINSVLNWLINNVSPSETKFKGDIKQGYKKFYDIISLYTGENENNEFTQVETIQSIDLTMKQIKNQEITPEQGIQEILNITRKTLQNQENIFSTDYQIFINQLKKSYDQYFPEIKIDKNSMTLKIENFLPKLGKYSAIQNDPITKVQQIIVKLINIMQLDTGRNLNDKTNLLFKSLLLISKKTNTPLNDYFENLTNKTISFLKVKKSNMNMVLLLQNLLKEYIPEGFNKVPEALQTLKPLRLQPQSQRKNKYQNEYLKFLQMKIDNDDQIFNLNNDNNSVNAIITFEYLLNYNNLKEISNEQKKQVLDNLPIYWQLNPQSKSYALNLILKSYEKLFKQKDDDLLEMIGNKAIEFMLKGNDSQNFDDYLNEDSNNKITPLIKLLWAYNNKGKNYTQNFSSEQKHVLLPANLFDENPKLKKFVKNYYYAQTKQYPSKNIDEVIPLIFNNPINLQEVQNLDLKKKQQEEKLNQPLMEVELLERKNLVNWRHGLPEKNLDLVLENIEEVSDLNKIQIEVDENATTINKKIYLHIERRDSPCYGKNEVLLNL